MMRLTPKPRAMRAAWLAGWMVLSVLGSAAPAYDPPGPVVSGSSLRPIRADRKQRWYASPAPISPSAGWNGTADSGNPEGTPLADQARTGPKSAFGFETVNWQRVIAGQTLRIQTQGGCAGGCFGSVVFTCEGNTVTATDQDELQGYSVLLTIPSNIPHDGVLKVYANAVPVDNTIQPRLIVLNIVVDNGTKVNLRHSYVDAPFIVDPAGNDSTGNGLVATPFATVKGAVIAIAAAAAHNDVSGAAIYVNNGSYFPDFYTGGSTVNCDADRCIVMPNPASPGATFTHAKAENYSPSRLLVRGFTFDGTGGSSGQWFGGGGGSDRAGDIWVDACTFVGPGATTNQIGQDGWGSWDNGIQFTNCTFAGCSYGLDSRSNKVLVGNTRTACSADAFCLGSNGLRARNSQSACVQWDAAGQHADDLPLEQDNVQVENIVDVEHFTDGFVGIGLSFVVTLLNKPIRDFYSRNRVYAETTGSLGFGGFDRFDYPMDHCVFDHWSNVTNHGAAVDRGAFIMAESMVISASSINLLQDAVITGNTSGATANVWHTTQTGSPVHVYGRTGTFQAGEALSVNAGSTLVVATFTSIATIMGTRNEFNNCAFDYFNVESDSATVKAFMLAHCTFSHCNFAGGTWAPGTGATTVSANLYGPNYAPGSGMPTVTKKAGVSRDVRGNLRAATTAVGGAAALAEYSSASAPSAAWLEIGIGLGD